MLLVHPIDMLGRHREGTIDATHYEGDAEKCRASAITDMDTTPEPSTLTTIKRLEITISLMHAMQCSIQMQILTTLN